MPISTVFIPDESAEPRPLLLLSYGCYGLPFLPAYGDVRSVLLRRRFVVGIAHLRGGGDLGHRWHLGGRGAFKANSVADLTACVDHLVQSGAVDPDRVVLRAQSAGASVVAAAVHRRPGLARAIVLDRPHLDVADVRRHGVFLTEFDLGEWGVEQRGGPSIGRWTPYENRPAPGRLPRMLLRPGLDDGRVAPDECQRYADFVRSTDRAAQVDIVPSPGQHGQGPASRRDQLRELVQVFGWILDVTQAW